MSLLTREVKTRENSCEKRRFYAKPILLLLPHSHLRLRIRRILTVYVNRNENDPNEDKPPLGNLLDKMPDDFRDYGERTYIDLMIAVALKFYVYRALRPSSQTVE